MQKFTLKLLSFALSIVMLAAACPMGAFASTSKTTIETDLSKVTGLEEKLATSENLVYGYEPLTTKGQVLSYHMSYTSGANVDAAMPIYSNQTVKFTNGVLKEDHGDLSGCYWFDSNKSWIDSYLDFTFSFPATASITNFLMASVNVSDPLQNDRRLWEYKVYASNSLDDLYTDANVKAHYDAGTGVATNGQYITFGETVEAKYLGVRILKGCNPNSANDNRTMTCARIREIAVIGSIDLPAEYQATNQGLINECKNQLDTNYNLLSTDYVAGAVGTPGTIAAGGSSAVPFDTAKSVFIVNHDISNHVDMGAPKFFSDSGYIEGTYLTLTFSLTHEAYIEKFFISHAINNMFNLRTYEYEVYTSMDYTTLYDSENTEIKALISQLPRFNKY